MKTIEKMESKKGKKKKKKNKKKKEKETSKGVLPDKKKCYNKSCSN